MIPLTKSRFLSSIQCRKKLYFEVAETVEPAPLSESDKRRFHEGTQVGELALKVRGEGALIDAANLNDAIEATARALASNTPRIFEAAILSDGMLVRPDILERGGEGWHLIEVKATTELKKAKHLPDIAYQLYVCESAGLSITRASLMHINNQCTAPDLAGLFALQNVTLQLRELLSELPEQAAAAADVLKAEQEPKVLIGSRCDSPYTCRYKHHCWAGVPEQSIFTIPRLHWKKKDTLVQQGVLAIKDVSPAFELPASQRRYVDFVSEGKTKISRQAIKEELSALCYPLYYFDIEALGPAIPWFDGMRPYEKLCFQFSCHIEHEPGRVEHREFLHRDSSDPRPAFLEALFDTIGENGEIVVWSASFERAQLKALGEWFPERRNRIDGLISRIWDQREIFVHHYHDPAFLGSKSLKAVLPALCPEHSYKELAVQDGDDAAAVWEQMLRSDNPEERMHMADELFAYCKLDTLAMVEIQNVLRAL